MHRATLLAVVLIAGQFGCASARYVQRDHDGGVIAIPDKSNDWPTYNRNKAEELIRAHLGPDYEIVEEWSASVDPPAPRPSSNRDVSTNSSVYFVPNQPPRNGSTLLADAGEWRIRYRRRGAGDGPATGPEVVPASHTEAAPRAVIPPPVLPGE